MITDVKSPAEPPRVASREQKSPLGAEQSNKGSSRQQLISQSAVQSSTAGAEKVSQSQSMHSSFKKFSSRNNILNQVTV
jgi:hypothetical protein